MYDVRNHTGRLVELWIESPSPREEAERSVADIRRAFHSAVKHGKAITATYLVHAATFAPEVSDLYVAMMKSDNPMIERSAFLVGEEAHTFTMQVERMIRDAGSPSRRSFRNASEYETWLGERLDPAERRRLRAFLDERNAAHR